VTKGNGYSPEEITQLGVEAREGAPLSCPHCLVPLDRRPVPPRADVSYVRDRVWVTCPSCQSSVVLDLKRPS